MKKAILAVIKFYQKTFSPDHGLVFSGTTVRCRFYPSCSQYSYEAVERYGALEGLFKSFKRVLRCSPLSKGGVDLLK